MTNIQRETSVNELVLVNVSRHSEAGSCQPPGDDHHPSPLPSYQSPAWIYQKRPRLPLNLPNQAVTHTCQISGCCPSYGSTAGSQWRESLSSQWSRRLDPSPRTTGCCCHWRRDEEGWRSHRRCWWLRRSLGSHGQAGGERGGVSGGERQREGIIVVMEEEGGRKEIKGWQTDVI